MVNHKDIFANIFNKHILMKIAAVAAPENRTQYLLFTRQMLYHVS
jgi:hypothetical protein